MNLQRPNPITFESYSPPKGEINLLPQYIKVALIATSQTPSREYDDWLSTEEKMRMCSLPLATAAKYFESRILIRWQLGQWLGIHPEEIRIKYEPNGAPFIENMQQHVSWSYGGQLLAVALSKNHSIGIDIECENRTGLSTGQLREAILPGGPSDFPVANLLANWTAREAILKAIHSGFQAYEPEEIILPEDYFNTLLPNPLNNTASAPDGTKMRLWTWRHAIPDICSATVSLAMANDKSDLSDQVQPSQ